MDQSLTFSFLPTVLLSGTIKVETVQSYTNIDCQKLACAGGMGITGAVHYRKTEYAYASAFDIAIGLAKRYPTPASQAAMVQSWGIRDYAGRLADVVRDDANCAVIDFLRPLDLNREDATIVKVRRCAIGRS